MPLGLLKYGLRKNYPANHHFTPASAEAAATLRDRWSFDATKRVCHVPRRHSHCRLALTGKQAAATLVKLCALDLRSHKFAELGVAQSSIVEVNAIVLRADLAQPPVFSFSPMSARRNIPGTPGWSPMAFR